MKSGIGKSGSHYDKFTFQQFSFLLKKIRGVELESLLSEVNILNKIIFKLWLFIIHLRARTENGGVVTIDKIMSCCLQLSTKRSLSKGIYLNIWNKTENMCSIHNTQTQVCYKYWFLLSVLEPSSYSLQFSISILSVSVVVHCSHFKYVLQDDSVLPLKLTKYSWKALEEICEFFSLLLLFLNFQIYLLPFAANNNGIINP